MYEREGVLRIFLGPVGVGAAIVVWLGSPRNGKTLERAREVLDAARHAGVFVSYCDSHFRPGFPEVSDRNKTRAATRAKCSRRTPRR